MPDAYDDDGNGSVRVELSPGGVRRREEILRTAVRAGRSVRRRRVIVRTVGCAAALLGAVMLIPLLRSWRPAPSQQAVIPRPDAPPVVEVHPPTPRPTNGVIVQRIATDPTLVDRLAVPAQPPSWQTLSDDEFLRQLDRAGRPAALAYVDGQERLLWREPPRHNTQ